MPRKELTLIELIIVFTIMAVLVSLLLPAVQNARERARETVFKNNLHQMELAFRQFADTHKRLPFESVPGIVGGWESELMPFLEQSAFSESAITGGPVSDASASNFERLRVFTCPVRGALTPDTTGELGHSHYVFAANTGRETAWFADAPMTVSVPWAECPEVTYQDLRNAKGPHHDGL